MNNGLTQAEITNAIPGYENTVLVNNNAGIKIHYAKDGKPVAGVSLVLSITPNSSYTQQDGRYEIKGNASAVTDSNGDAVFTVGNARAVKSNDTSQVASFNYSVKTVSDNVELAAGELKFAAIQVQNVEKDAPNDLTLSSNINNDTNKTNGVAATANTRTVDSNNGGNNTSSTDHNVQYVYSQQVSKGSTDDHKVTFKGGVAQIVLPSREAAAVTKTQAVNYSSGQYHTYETNAHVVKLEVKPTELDYATLNFKSIRISKHTRLVISAYTNETDAKNGSSNNKVNLKNTSAPNTGHNWDYIIDGTASQNNFGYQVPLKNWVGTNDDDLYFRVCVESAGRVNVKDDANAGFEWSDILYVYKAATSRKAETYKGATIEWSKADTRMSEPKLLDSSIITLLQNSNPNEEVVLSGTKTVKDGSNKDTQVTIVRAEYQVPVFPYTGNAVIKTYDKNNKVIDYYAYPTVNSVLLNGWDIYGVAYSPWDGTSTAANENKLPFIRKSGVVYPLNSSYRCYQISANEADNSVGTVTNNAENNTVTVNSTETGYTLLKGELKVDGKPISEVLKGFDDANSTVYTSVQWNPVAETTNHTGFIALKGQTVTVTAQLTDQNGNPVAQSGIGVKFTQEGSTSNLEVGKKIDGKDATVITNETVTDINGQARLVLNSGNIATITGIAAEPVSNRQYRTTVTVGTGNKKAESADLYWIDANLSFRSAVDAVEQKTDATTIDTIVNKELKTSTDTATINPGNGEKWEYGVKIVGTSKDTKQNIETDKLYGGIWDGKTVEIQNLLADISKGENSVGTVTRVQGRNAATVESYQSGTMDVINAILPQNLGADVKFKVSDVDEVQDNAGTGTTTINKRLTIRAVWGVSGRKISIFRAGSNNVAGTDATVYIRTTDQYGNYVDGKSVDIKVVNGTFTDAYNPIDTPKATGTVISSTLGNVTTGSAYEAGLIRLNVQKDPDANVKYTTITVTDNETNQSDAYTITWTLVSGDPFALNVKQSGDNATEYVSRYDGKGKITLTFNQDIIQDTVKKGAFTVIYDSKEYVIDSIAFPDRRRVELTVSELSKVGVAANVPIKVEIRKVNIAEVDYVITSLNGELIDTYNDGSEKTEIEIFQSSKPNVTKADTVTKY